MAQNAPLTVSSLLTQVHGSLTSRTTPLQTLPTLEDSQFHHIAHLSFMVLNLLEVIWLLLTHSMVSLQDVPKSRDMMRMSSRILSLSALILLHLRLSHSLRNTPKDSSNAPLLLINPPLSTPLSLIQLLLNSSRDLCNVLALSSKCSIARWLRTPSMLSLSSTLQTLNSVPVLLSRLPISEPLKDRKTRLNPSLQKPNYTLNLMSIIQHRVPL